ncbi:PAS domain S-box-containing protein [Halomicrobium zhouii]|uniref:histidine kinase n=1 Tax=Halomicrobium zhouii TaxID=767519 RepID=A0A1I6KNN0_9EURY|nr:PAS domain S-box protein [Halomicrobium zhouii]SFR92791.1 PAS domain S-box-containing protein [Halomicrobium zhouii]
MNDADGGEIRVLHVDDDADFAEMVGMQLRRQNEEITVVTETNVDDGLARLQTEDVDCVVSDHDMPGKDGLAFLRAVREAYPELPFVLFTGKGSEEIASDAISAGVTEYLQKETGTDQYAVLANRIEQAVSSDRAKRALEESERRLSTLISNLPGMVYRCRNERGWPMTFVSDGAAALTGYSADAIESGDVSWNDDVIREADREAVWERVQTAVRADEPFEVTYRIETADGEERWVWERGRTVESAEESGAIEGFVTDITARKERERELEDEREFTEDVLNSLSDVFFVVGTDGSLRRWNDRVNEVTGYTDEQIAASDAIEFFAEADRPKARQAFGRAFDGERVQFEGTVEPIDGEAIPFEFRGTALTDADGEVVGVSGVGRDVSERKTQQRELEAFASLVSHDLRNPLNVVQGRVQLALESGSVENLAAASDAADRMERLIDDVVRLTRQGHDIGDVEPVEVADVAAEAWDKLEADGSSLTVETARTVEANPDRFRELLAELFQNAVQHGADDDGGVSVRVGDTDGGFFVADDGAGIDPDRRPDVFDEGYTTSTDGTGLGLPLVERIAAAHGWTVTVAESEREEGARFEITV